FISSRRRHTRFSRDWSSDVCSSDLAGANRLPGGDKSVGNRPPPPYLAGGPGSGGGVLPGGGRLAGRLSARSCRCRAAGRGPADISEERRVGQEGRGKSAVE